MSFSLVGTATGATGTGSLTPTMPTYAEGDLALFFGFARTNTETVSSGPSGYTLLKAGIAGAGNSGNLVVYAKKCAAVEAAPSITYSGSGRHIAVMAVLRSTTGWPDIAVAADIVVTSVEANSSSLSGVRAKGITPAENDCCVVAVSGKSTTSNDAVAVSTPSGYTDAAVSIHNSATAGTLIVAWFLGQTTAATVSDQGGTITVTNDAGRCDQITLALRTAASTTKYLKVRTNSAAQSASSVSGVVFNAPSGSDITGTKIGEFTGKSFSGTLESGQAVLLVPVADFGGSSLTTASTPVAIVRNTTYTTGAVSCTVIEE